MLRLDACLHLGKISEGIGCECSPIAASPQRCGKRLDWSGQPKVNKRHVQLSCQDLHSGCTESEKTNWTLRRGLSGHEQGSVLLPWPQLSSGQDVMTP